LLPHFREQKDGTIVFLGSTSAWITYAGVSAYGASKAAIGRRPIQVTIPELKFSKLISIGAVDGLAREVGPSGIKVLSIDAGGFGSQMVHSASNHSPPSQHYEWLMDAIRDSFKWLTKNNAGDTTKLANLIIDLVKSEGVAEGKTIPPRIPKAPNDLFEEWANPAPNDIPLSLPAGSDAIDAIKARCEAVLRVINQWEEVIRTTDVEAKE
jgi:NAD(P)-dependent dehydrogenase (short-subunit alcohol dehydrogenase family)